jgi:serine protease AprX
MDRQQQQYAQAPRGQRKRIERAFHISLLSILVLLLALVPGLSMAAPPLQMPSVHALVWDTIREQGQADVLVVLKAQADLSVAGTLPTKLARGSHTYQALRSVAETTQQDLRASLDAKELDYQTFYIVNAIRLRVDAALVRTLASRSDVARIVPNPRVPGVPSEFAASQVEWHGAVAEAPYPATSNAPLGVEPNLSRVRADEVWALGYTGQGVVVAGQDTGYDWDHPALKNQYRGWDGREANHDYNWHDAIHTGGGACGPDAFEPCDDHGHGTHTMGTIVGDDAGGVIRDDIGRNQIGMAPGAEWIGCRNMDEGVGTPATYLECFEFFLAPYPVDGTPEQGDPALAPHVVNNSWSCPPSEGCDLDTLETAVEVMRQAGIMVVVSSGNSGPGCGSVNRPPTLYEQSFSVGAFDHRSGQIAGFSSRGPVTYRGRTYVKPEVTAPGVGIRSSVPGEGYGYASGTSMAAPHVTGAIALLFSAAPGYRGKVDVTEEILAASSAPVPDAQCGDPEPPNNVWGWGILDALAAVEMVAAGTLQGTVTNAETGRPIDGAKVAAVLSSQPGSGSEATSNSTGHYTLTLPAGIYDLTTHAGGYQEQRVDGVVITPGEITTQDFALPPLRYRIIIQFGIPVEP